MRDSSLPSPDHSCNTARPVSLPCDDLMTQICTMSSPLSGSSGAYCSEPLILLSATRTPTQAQTSRFFSHFFTFFKFFLAFAFFTIYLMVLRTTALQNCYRALRSARWSVRRKDEHMTRCCEVRELYAKCQVNLGCVLFDPDMSPAKDYLDMVKGKKATKRQLDIQLRNCKRYLLYQFDELEKSVAGIPTEKTS